MSYPGYPSKEQDLKICPQKISSYSSSFDSSRANMNSRPSLRPNGIQSQRSGNGMIPFILEIAKPSIPGRISKVALQRRGPVGNGRFVSHASQHPHPPPKVGSPAHIAHFPSVSATLSYFVALWNPWTCALQPSPMCSTKFMWWTGVSHSNNVLQCVRASLMYAIWPWQWTANYGGLIGLPMLRLQSGWEELKHRCNEKEKMSSPIWHTSKTEHPPYEMSKTSFGGSLWFPRIPKPWPTQILGNRPG